MVLAPTGCHDLQQVQRATLAHSGRPVLPLHQHQIPQPDHCGMSHTTVLVYVVTLTQSQGAYDQAHVYSQKDIAAVIKFAHDRGIRVIVEFDTPVSCCCANSPSFSHSACHRATPSPGAKVRLICSPNAILVPHLLGMSQFSS